MTGGNTGGTTDGTTGAMIGGMIGGTATDSPLMTLVEGDIAGISLSGIDLTDLITGRRLAVGAAVKGKLH